MKTKYLMLVLAGLVLGVALSTSVLTLRADDAPPVDPTAEALKKLTEQNEKLLAGHDAVMKELGEIKADIQFLKARSGSR